MWAVSVNLQWNVAEIVQPFTNCYWLVNMPPQVDGERDWSIKLSRMNWNFVDESPLAKMSASWSSVEMNWSWRAFLATWSRTQWKSISTCLVRAWKTGFAERYVAPILSHQSMGVFWGGIFSSVSNDWSQINSTETSDRSLYSASVDDRETVFCFLDC